MLRVTKQAFAVILGALLIVLTSAAMALVLIPAFVGGTNLTVLTGSMAPRIQPGDVVVTRGVDSLNESSFSIGDIIAFLPYPDDPTVVIHRIIGITVTTGEVHYVTQGDNNDSPDPWGPVAASHVRGEVIYIVPKIGYAKVWLGEHARSVVVVIAVALIAYGTTLFTASFRTRNPASHTSKARSKRP